MTMDNGNVRWDQPIEAVHEDGRVVAVTVGENEPDDDGHYRVYGNPSASFFHGDGTHTGLRGLWTIRNVAKTKADKWGPEIKVEGKRPEWLGDGVPVMIHWYYGDMFEASSECILGWDGSIKAIQVKANHPHYKTLQDDMPQNAPETHRQGTNGVRTGVEALERMEALVRRMAAMNVDSMEHRIESLFIEADNIVRDLPEPVDPDIQIARDIIADAYEAGDNVDAQHRSDWAGHCRSGAYDDDYTFVATFAAIKRGRALERDDAAARSHGGM